MLSLMNFKSKDNVQCAGLITLPFTQIDFLSIMELMHNVMNQQLPKRQGNVQLKSGVYMHLGEMHLNQPFFFH